MALMASFNLTVEDSSPLIAYSPAGSWVDSPIDDPIATTYSGGSYHVSTAPGATATITFTGTGLSIFGGHRSNYGTYSISLDGQTISSGSSQSNDLSTRQLLGSASGLPYGSHTAVLTSTGGGPIDIDWVDVNARAGPPGSVVAKKTFDDNDSTIVYQPSSADWLSNSNPAFLDGTLRYSQTPGASASLTFSGDAVALYGTVSPDHADIRISVDGREQRFPGGAGVASVVHPQVLLYYRGDLGAGEHTIVLSGDQQPNSGPFIDLDFVDVFTLSVPPDASSTPIVAPTGAAASDKTAAPVPPSSPTASLSSSRMPIGTIAVAVIGGFLALLLLLGLAAFLLLRRRRRQSTTVEKPMISVSPSLPMQREPKAMEAGYQVDDNPYSGIVENPAFPLPPGQKQASLRHSIAPSYYSKPSFVRHSREPSINSVNSSTLLVPSVPTISIPKPRSIPRKPAPGRSGLIQNVSPTPVRPSNRPPTLDFMYMESPS